MSAVRRVTAILLLLAFAGSGSGATAALHRVEHARDREHAVHADDHVCHADGHSGHADADQDPRPLAETAGHGHDAGECRACADLRAPAVADRWGPAVVPVRAAAPLLRPLVAQRARIDAPLRIETTGPPLS